MESLMRGSKISKELKGAFLAQGEETKTKARGDGKAPCD